MKKRIMAALLAACMMVTLTACGESKASNDYITISQYKGLEVTKVDKTTVSDADVESTIQSTLEENATSKNITDREAKSGDTVDMDYKLTLDGKKKDEKSGYQLELGSGSTIDGFEDEIIGHKAGDKFKFKIKFPSNYQDTDLAGNEGEFTITFNAIVEKTVPELDDAFVKKVSEKSKTVKEYKEEVKKQLESDNETTYNDTLRSEAWSAVLEKTEVTKYPDGEVEAAEKKIKASYEQMATYYGMDWSTFLTNYLGMDEDTFSTQLTTAAQTSVKEKQVVELLCKKLKLTPSDKEYTKAMKAYVTKYGFDSLDALKEAATEDELKQMVREDKVKEYLADNCIQVEAAATTAPATSGTTGSTSTSSSSSAE